MTAAIEVYVAPDTAEALSMLKDMYDDLVKRRPEMVERDAYYEGQHPLKFASQSFSDFQRDRYKGFSDNWCGVVANSPAERLSVVGFRLDDEAGLSPTEKDLWADWRTNDLEVQSSQGLLESFVASTSYVLVWGDRDGNPSATWEHPGQVIIEYDDENPRLKTAALKVWDDAGWEYATLYTPTDVWKFERRIMDLPKNFTVVTAYGTSYDSSGWQPRAVSGEPWPVRNPLGEVPFVEAMNRPLLSRKPLSEVQGAMAMQDAINLLWALTFTAADFASLPARVVMGQEPPKIPILDNTGQIIGSKPVPIEQLEQGRMLWLTGQNTSIGQFQAADLAAFTDVVETAVGHLAAQTRTPQHYLIGKMANMSADALKAAETGLVKKVEEAQTFFGPPVRDIFRLMALVRNQTGVAEAARLGRVQWKDAESRSEAQLVDALQKLQALGFPFEWIAERYGLSADDITRLVAMKESDRASQASATAAAFGIDNNSMMPPQPGPPGIPGASAPAPLPE